MDILIVSLIVLLFFAGVWYFFGQGIYNTNIISQVQAGTVETTMQEQQKTEVSYTGWIIIDDFNPYGKEKVIFVKGSEDTTLACPALVIDAHTNSLLVKVDTFGNQEIIPISNIPTKKWLHFAIVLNEHYLKVYINGIEHTSKYLTMLPKSNTAQVLVSPKGGFSGRITKFNTYSKSLEYDEITKLSKDVPSTGDVVPPYFDISWLKS